MSTPRNGVDITGIGPSYGSAAEDLPQQPTSPVQLSESSTTTLETDEWKIGEQGETYDGCEFYVVNRLVAETLSSGVVKIHHIGRKVTLNADGKVVKLSAEKTLLTEEQSGTASGGFGLW